MSLPSDRLAQEAEARAQKQLAEAQRERVMVQRGAFNTYAARRKVEEVIAKVGKGKTIAALHNNVNEVLSAQISEGITVMTEQQVVERAAWMYLRENGFPHSPDHTVLARHAGQHQIEFDADYYQTLRVTGSDEGVTRLSELYRKSDVLLLEAVDTAMSSLQAPLSTKRRTVEESDALRRTVTEGTRQRHQYLETLIQSASRAEEVEIVLAHEEQKQRSQQRESMKHVHLMFNVYWEVCYVAMHSIKEKDSKRYQRIICGELRNDGVVATAVRGKTQEKYARLAEFFQRGCFLRSLSVDYAFDGAQFYELRPFKTGGHIVSLNLDLDFCKKAYVYVEREVGCCDCCLWMCCKPPSPSLIRASRMKSVTSVSNIDGLFMAIAEGLESRQRLNRLSLRSNYLSPVACSALAEMCRDSGLEHLDLFGVKADEESWTSIATAVGRCCRLLTFNISCTKAKDEALAGVFAALASSSSTLVEVVCDSHAGEGTASTACVEPLKSVLFFPRLASISLLNQALPTSFVGAAGRILHSAPNITYMNLVGMSFVQDAEVHIDGCCDGCPCPCFCRCLPDCMRPECCCGKDTNELCFDRPSDKALSEIERAYQENIVTIAQKRQHLTVQHMLTRYREQHAAATEARLQRLREAQAARDAAVYTTDVSRELRMLRAASASATHVVNAPTVQVSTGDAPTRVGIVAPPLGAAQPLPPPHVESNAIQLH